MRGALYVATGNAGKLEEFRALFAATAWVPQRCEVYGDVAEGETSYVENAALKARALRAILLRDGVSAAVIGDDSGLEVNALGGRPGVLSARYGGPDVTWRQRRERLRDEIGASGSPDRAARFVCALHFVGEDGRETRVLAEVAGTIAEADLGDGGFSYDAVFWYPPAGRTFAQMSAAEKNAISHRGVAVHRLLAALEASHARPRADNRADAVKDAGAGM